MAQSLIFNYTITLKLEITVTLDNGLVYAVMKKPKKTVVGIYSTAEKAEQAIEELNGHKYFRKQKYLLDTQIDRKRMDDGEDILLQKLIIDKSVYNSPAED